MAMAGLQWPTKDEYDLAIMQWQSSVLDPDLRGGTLAQDAMGIQSYGGANLYVALYNIGDWMMRCFCSNPPHVTPPDILERYRAIDRFYRANGRRVSVLLPIALIEQGIVVGERVLPFVKMPFLRGVPSLGEFIADYFTDADVMQHLADAWFQVIRELEAAPMAHGDLDLTNVLVERRGAKLALRLIDYDNAWIPELAGCEQTEFGHAAFQHPAFFTARTRPYAADMDRFAALVIYISIKMLAQRPELYDEWHADESEQLVLSQEDYLNAQLAGSHIAQLRRLSRSELWPYIDELSVSLREGRMPQSLPEIATRVRPPSQPLAPSAHPASEKLSSLASGIAVSNWESKIYNGATALQPAIQPLPTSSGALNDDVAPIPPTISTLSMPSAQLAQPAPLALIEATMPAAPIGNQPGKATVRAKILVILLILLVVAAVVGLTLLILSVTHVPGFVASPVLAAIGGSYAFA